MPVLLDAVLAGLKLRPAGIYIDGTFGRGGHSRHILRALGEAGRLLAIDRDPQAIAEADPQLIADPRFELTRKDIGDLQNIALERHLQGRVDGILFDLGVSSPQLDDAERGFSFQSDGPLDMRMDPGRGESAADWLARVDERELKRVLKQYGEEAAAAGIARAIVRARSEQPVRRTRELADIVERVVPRHRSRRHPATKTFQAIRMVVNDELAQIASALEATIGVLAPGGRLCVISFHSLEDRLVKRFMRDHSREAEAYRGMPEVPPEARPTLRLIGKPIAASDAEQASNPRSRSARLRVAERVA